MTTDKEHEALLREMGVAMVAVCSSCGHVYGPSRDDFANKQRVICPACGMDPGPPDNPMGADGFWLAEIGERTSVAVWWKPWTRGRYSWVRRL